MPVFKTSLNRVELRHLPRSTNERFTASRLNTAVLEDLGKKGYDSRVFSWYRCYEISKTAGSSRVRSNTSVTAADVTISRKSPDVTASGSFASHLAQSQATAIPIG